MARGQASLVLILITLILLSIVAFFLIKPRMTAQQSEISELQSALHACAQTSLEQAITEAKTHGGKPRLALLDEAYANGKLTEQSLLTLKDKLVLDRTTHSFLPLWLTLTPCASGKCFVSYAPPLRGAYDEERHTYPEGDTSLEARLARRVSTLTQACIASFSTTHPDYTLDTRVDTRIHLSEKRVTADITLRGVIEKDEKRFDRVTTRVRVDTQLVRLYTDALRLTLLEATLAPIAQGVYDYLLLATGLDQPFPPVSAVEISYTPRVWTVQGVRDAFNAQLPVWLSTIRLATRSDLNHPSTLVLPLATPRGTPLGEEERVSIRLAQPAELSFREGSIIMPTQQEALSSAGLLGTILSALLPIQTYHATYSFELPLVVTLTRGDESFRFALRTGVWQGKPVTIGTRLDTSLQPPAQAYCAHGVTPAHVTLKTPGGRSARATLRFTCGDQACAYSVEDGETIMLPACVNARITFTPDTDAYAFEPLIVTTTPDTPLTLQPAAQRKQSLRLELDLHPLVKETDPTLLLDGTRFEPLSVSQESYTPLAGEDVFITLLLTREDVPSIQTVQLTQDTLAETPILTLYEGEYNLHLIGIANYTRMHGVRIPEQHGCAISIPIIDVCILGEYTIPEVTLNTSMLTLLDTRITIPRDADTLRITLPVFDPALIPEDARRLDDLTILADWESLFTAYPSLGVSVE